LSPPPNSAQKTRVWSWRSHLGICFSPIFQLCFVSQKPLEWGKWDFGGGCQTVLRDFVIWIWLTLDRDPQNGPVALILGGGNLEKSPICNNYFRNYYGILKNITAVISALISFSLSSLNIMKYQKENVR
jgi:hypothetical protein